jgi:hypothetical protein
VKKKAKYPLSVAAQKTTSSWLLLCSHATLSLGTSHQPCADIISPYPASFLVFLLHFPFPALVSSASVLRAGHRVGVGRVRRRASRRCPALPSLSLSPCGAHHNSLSRPEIAPQPLPWPVFAAASNAKLQRSCQVPRSLNRETRGKAVALLFPEPVGSGERRGSTDTLCPTRVGQESHFPHSPCPDPPQGVLSPRPCCLLLGKTWCF